MSQTIPAYRLAWCSDLHLNFVEHPAETFLGTLRSCRADLLLLTGDIATARSLEAALAAVGMSFPGKVAFVCGNHDCYHGELAEMQHRVARVVAEAPNLVRLAGKPLIHLGPACVLLGVDGWACGQAGYGRKTRIRLNDFRMIRDFAALADDSSRFNLMTALAGKATKLLTEPLLEAAKHNRHVVVATHVPPFAEAAWHELRLTDADHLPHFCNLELGRVLQDVAPRHSQTQFTVLCGHTHSEGFYRRDNVQVVTARASYRQPEVYRVFPRAFWGWAADRREAWHRLRLGAGHPLRLG